MRTALLPLTVLSLLLSSCTGPGFSVAYRDAVDDYQDGDAKPAVAGPWQGYWKSDVNGHTGKLRAIATRKSPQQIPPATEQMEFRYHATWAKILSGGYTADTRLERRGDGTYVTRSEKKLGVLGVYTSEGIVNGDTFESSYRSDSDHGVFILKRPATADAD